MKLKGLLLSVILPFMGVLFMLQVHVVLAIASDPENPITSAITSAINQITNNSQNNNTQNSASPSPTPASQGSSEPVTSPVISSPSPSASASASPSGTPLTSPVIHEINPATAYFGDRITVRTIYNVLTSPLVYVGDALMPDSSYQYHENNTAVSFILSQVNNLLETGRNYLARLFAFGSNSNEMELYISSPVVNPTPSAVPTASASPSTSPAPSPTPNPDYYIETKPNNAVYMVAPSPLSSGYSVLALLRDKNGNVVTNQQNMEYVWSIEQFNAGHTISLEPFTGCTYGITEPCPKDHANVSISHVGSTSTANLWVNVYNKQTSQFIARAEFVLNFVPQDEFVYFTSEKPGYFPNEEYGIGQTVRISWNLSGKPVEYNNLYYFGYKNGLYKSGYIATVISPASSYDWTIPAELDGYEIKISIEPRGTVITRPGWGFSDWAFKVSTPPSINTLSPNPATWGTHIVLTGSNLTNSAKVYFDDQLIGSPVWKANENDDTTMEFTMPLFTNHRANQTYKLSVRQNGVKSNEVDLTIAPSLAYNTATPSANQVLIDPQVNLDTNHTEVLMAYSNFNANISVPGSVTNATLNFSSLLTHNPYTNESFADFNNALTINSNTHFGTIMVELPTATQITGPGDWNGIMNAPRVLNNAGINLDGTVQSVIEIGLGDAPLTFNKGVRILIPGQAGKLAGFQRGSQFTKIINSCSADTQTAGDNLPDNGDCHISVGNDLVIWTKHFTKFVTYTQTPVQNSSNTGSSGSSSSGGGSSQAPVCGDSKPQSAPKLVYAKNTGRNEVTLVWTKALDPVSYYLVAYGTKTGKLEYGNPNVGGKDTISYVVKGLNNGSTYYFRVRAGNGCMPGEYSNEEAVKVTGDKITGTAKGFKAGVLGSAKTEIKYKPITAAKPVRVISTSEDFITKVLKFIRRFMIN